MNEILNHNAASGSENSTAEDHANDEKIVYCKIHPAVGIARVGNSPDEYFIGPELPEVSDLPNGGYKDAGDLNKGIPPRIKRQAARFRIYGYNASGKPVKEILFADAEIEWTVHLANKKAEWDQFQGRRGEELPIGQRQPRGLWRNRDIRGDGEKTDEAARQVLIIDSGAKSLKTPNEAAEFNEGKFFDISVPLGEMRTDSVGRLLVLGGFGKSGTAEPGRRITNYANNDRWHDDISDGPVTAKVKLKSGEELKVEPAWVVVAPPDYAPGIPNIVTLYDVVYETAVGLGYPAQPERPSFTQHIFPILQRPLMMTWVQFEAISGHGAESAKTGNFLRNWEHLISNDAEHKEVRQKIFSFLRDPNATGEQAAAQANKNFMPPLSGDNGDVTDGEPGTWLTLTKTQYAILKKWADGDFEADWAGASVQPPTEITPEGLDRAALEACAGGAFFPGIEGGWMFRNPAYYSEPFRLDHNKLAPGDVTKRMAVPWQADFYECKDNWWPAQRPDQVLTLRNYERIKALSLQIANPELNKSAADKFIRETLLEEVKKLYNERVLWARSLPSSAPAGDNEMVHKWKRLGFLADKNKDGTSFSLNGLPAFVETETVKYQNLSMAEYFHYLVNIEDYPDFLPMARELALDFFSKADYSASPNFAYFDYTPEAFDERMDKIYNEYTATMDDPHWLDAEKFSTQAVVENLRQKAPMNLVDGAWLQNILNTGPCNDIQARLFAIWADEAGNGKTELNHCNVYDALLRSVNVYLPPITSRQFVETDLLASAWSNPVFQLSVGRFPQEFFPELLGMTLYLEWEATPTLASTVRMLRGRGINPQFYSLHVAIDNVASGHGALAKEAVKLHLDEIRESGGEREVQDQWKRIWNGYVTWATEGTFFSDLYDLLLNLDGKKEEEDRKKYAAERMISLIRRKAPYARKAHGTLMLGKGANSRPLNALFDDPPALMKALLEDPDGWINLEKPRDSRFFNELLSFSGPMYKVFTEEDKDIILDWLESLRTSQPVPQPPEDIGQKMKEVIEARLQEARTEPRHRDFNLPDNAGNMRTVHDWFQETPELVMEALSNSKYIVKGSAETSRFFTEVLVRGDLMGGVNFSEEEVANMKSWVDKGCPQPGQTDEEPHLFMLSHVKTVARLAAEGDSEAIEVERMVPFAQRRLLIGAGSVH